MDDYSGSGKLIRYSFYSLSRFLMKQKKSRLLSFVWVILILSFIVFTSTSYAGNGDDLVEAAHTGNLSKVRALLKKETDVDHENSVGATALIIASREGHEVIVQGGSTGQGCEDQPPGQKWCFSPDNSVSGGT